MAGSTNAAGVCMSLRPLLFAGAVLAAPALSHAADAAGTVDVVKIGHVAATSGAVAYFGKDNENGARMAVEALNARGVTVAGKKVRFELVAEDDAGDPKQATAAA